jgi:hypothetical protein
MHVFEDSKFPYRIEVDIHQRSIDMVELHDAIMWCNDYIGNHWIDWYLALFTFGFRRESDLIALKLRWSG